MQTWEMLIKVTECYVEVPIGWIKVNFCEWMIFGDSIVVVVGANMVTNLQDDKVLYYWTIYKLNNLQVDNALY